MKSIRELIIDECKKRKIDYEPADHSVGIMSDTWAISTDELEDVCKAVMTHLIFALNNLPNQ